METAEDKKMCCDKEMIYLGDVNYCSQETEYTIRWICGECGRIIDLTAYTLDDDELKDFLSNYENELKDTNIFKELKGG